MKGPAKKTAFSLAIFFLIFLSRHFPNGLGSETQPPANSSISWHSYLGSAGWDDGKAITVDRKGNVYMIGQSAQSWGNPIDPFAGDKDVFVAKLSKKGKLLWNTFLGSKAYDEGRGIAVDPSGNVYIVGSSAKSWGKPVHAHMGDDRDAFAARLSSQGELKWHTFMGGNMSGDRGMAIAVDGQRNVHVAGFGAAFWDTQPVYPISSGTDGWVTKLSPAGVRLWYTPMGSSNLASIRALTLDSTGNIFVAGWSEGAFFRSPVDYYVGELDTFAAKLDSRGVMQWHTFMGSKRDDSGMGIALDGMGNILVSGTSDKTWGDPINPFNGAMSAFVAKLNPNGGLIWNTFTGRAGAQGHYGWAVGADDLGNVYASGGFPLLKLDHEGSFKWAVSMMHLIGEGNSIHVDPSGNIFVGCRGSEVEWDESPVEPFAGDDDAMAVKIDRGIRIASWNLMGYAGGRDSSRNDEIRKVVDVIAPDILVVQEMEKAKASAYFLKNVLNKNSQRKYKAAKFHNGPDTDNALFYDEARIRLIDQNQIPTSFRDVSEYSLEIKEGPAEGCEFKVYSVHFTEGRTSTHKQQRLDQATTLRSYLNGLPSDSAFVVCGTFNMTASKEKAYRILMKSQGGDSGGVGINSGNGNNGRMMDPVEISGKWSDKPKFRYTHTESTRKSEAGDGTGGGLDDRYDMILLSYAMTGDGGLTYMPGSCVVIGNDGKRLNEAVNAPENRIFNAALAEALYKASDHLPVIIDLNPSGKK
jgi:endonuclease/exonuclease/phosphatase family metal-dependent hydrolase